ncbi:unnamed protein product [Clonostachys rhizophaga]|uniref:Uncharacterized protein n=1 Tax=Clonostachys rhizophaga TaxID=160324 RepID=A0A9N9V3T4_9HYPO|nr:unnamed protein product [Clonostachys rhizophaga]
MEGARGQCRGYLVQGPRYCMDYVKVPADPKSLAAAGAERANERSASVCVPMLKSAKEEPIGGAQYSGGRPAYGEANGSLARRGHAKPAKAWHILAGSYLPDGVCGTACLYVGRPEAKVSFMVQNLFLSAKSCQGPPRPAKTSKSPAHPFALAQAVRVNVKGEEGPPGPPSTLFLFRSRCHLSHPTNSEISQFQAPSVSFALAWAISFLCRIAHSPNTHQALSVTNR